MVIAHSAVEQDDRVMINVFWSFDAAITLYIQFAGVRCPGSIRNLAADECFLGRRHRTNSNICLTLRKIEIPIAHDKLDTRPPIACVKFVDQPRCKNARPDIVRARHLYRSPYVFAPSRRPTLKICCYLLNAFGITPQLLSELG